MMGQPRQMQLLFLVYLLLLQVYIFVSFSSLHFPPYLLLFILIHVLAIMFNTKEGSGISMELMAHFHGENKYIAASLISGLVCT